MHTIEVNEIWTLLVALLTIGPGTRVIARAAPRAFLVVTLAASLVQRSHQCGGGASRADVGRARGAA